MGKRILHGMSISLRPATLWVVWWPSRSCSLRWGRVLVFIIDKVPQWILWMKAERTGPSGPTELAIADTSFIFWLNVFIFDTMISNGVYNAIILDWSQRLWGSCVRVMFCYAVLSVISSLAIILMRKRESGLLNFNSLPSVLWLLVLCGSSSWCRGLIRSVWFWHFMFILNYILVLATRLEMAWAL